MGNETRPGNAAGGRGEVGRQWRRGAQRKDQWVSESCTTLDSFQPSSAQKLLWNSLWLLKGRSLFIRPLKEIMLMGSGITKTRTTCCQERRSGFVCWAECFFHFKNWSVGISLIEFDSFMSAFLFLKDKAENQILSVLLQVDTGCVSCHWHKVEFRRNSWKSVCKCVDNKTKSKTVWFKIKAY